jgi:hypothetical protein
LKGRIALGVFATMVTVIAGLCLINPEATRLAFAVALGALTANWHPPHIVGLQISDDDWRGHRSDVVSGEFTALIQKKFPQGTDESRFKSELLEAGFWPFSTESGSRQCQPPIQTEPLGWASVTCNYPRNVFVFRWSLGLVCGASLLVSWSTDDSDKITRVAGHFNSSCL